jgi:hypothetical protein
MNTRVFGELGAMSPIMNGQELERSNAVGGILAVKTNEIPMPVT